VRTVKCPFIPHHIMPYERFLSHLEKCQFPDKKSYSKCRFNPYHVYHMSALAEHEKSNYHLMQNVPTRRSTKITKTMMTGELKTFLKNQS
jgi:hypothetical protein